MLEKREIQDKTDLAKLYRRRAEEVRTIAQGIFDQEESQKVMQAAVKGEKARRSLSGNVPQPWSFQYAAQNFACPMKVSARRHDITADKTKRLVGQYKTLADQAKRNAAMAPDRDSREWFLSLAKTMSALANALGSGLID
jgi:hypothetical protein